MYTKITRKDAVAAVRTAKALCLNETARNIAASFTERVAARTLTAGRVYDDLTSAGFTETTGLRGSLGHSVFVKGRNNVIVDVVYKPKKNDVGQTSAYNNSARVSSISISSEEPWEIERTVSTSKWDAGIAKKLASLADAVAKAIPAWVAVTKIADQFDRK